MIDLYELWQKMWIIIHAIYHYPIISNASNSGLTPLVSNIRVTASQLHPWKCHQRDKYRTNHSPTRYEYWYGMVWVQISRPPFMNSQLCVCFLSKIGTVFVFDLFMLVLVCSIVLIQHFKNVTPKSMSKSCHPGYGSSMIFPSQFPRFTQLRMGRKCETHRVEHGAKMLRTPQNLIANGYTSRSWCRIPNSFSR